MHYLESNLQNSPNPVTHHPSLSSFLKELTWVIDEQFANIATSCPEDCLWTGRAGEPGNETIPHGVLCGVAGKMGQISFLLCMPWFFYRGIINEWFF